jgi:hypothetical protein
MYDTFKLVITIILVAVLLRLSLGFDLDSQSPTPPPVTLQEGTITPSMTSSPSITSSGTPAVITPTPTLTHTPTPTSTQTITPTSTPSSTPTITATTTLTPTATVIHDICSLALESRLAVGHAARVRTNLNFRVAPGLDQEILLVHLTGVRLEIIGGPVCTPYENGAYMWWQVQRPDGNAGWSAEGSARRFFYFLEPVN